MAVLEAPELWLARWLFVRLVGVAFLLAFVNAALQFPALLGDDGLLPARRFLDRTDARSLPSLFRGRYSDRLLRRVAWTGAGLSGAVALGLVSAAPLWVWLATWVVVYWLYLSIVHAGQVFYAFGWESILLEAATIAAVVGNDAVAPTWPAVLMARWLLFRVEFGAGLIKLRGDPCWRDLTCLQYHHETQPIPGPLSRWFHHLPNPLHRVEVAANHVVQLGAPVLLFLPQPLAGVGGMAVVVTQSWLMMSGNFAWLNLVTLTLGVLALPSSLLAWLPVEAPTDLAGPPPWYLTVVLGFAAVTVALSHRPVRNMASRRQVMNRSFNPLHLVGTYGAFGSITRVRHELVLEATLDDPGTEDARWEPYEFRGKPTDVMARPRQVAPYHLRLDWLMWFAAMPGGREHSWLRPLLQRLLEGDPATLGLLRRAPFGTTAPRAVRILGYRYRFSTRAERRETGATWVRDRRTVVVPPLDLASDRSLRRLR